METVKIHFDKIKMCLLQLLQLKNFFLTIFLTFMLVCSITKSAVAYFVLGKCNSSDVFLLKSVEV